MKHIADILFREKPSSVIFVFVKICHLDQHV